ncbi:hypothetical protein NLX83_04010 [Allokutzneria sp. A3M-2-11 16]|uniref:hypothetical protein n=1 Tax=Allokutzneria sp. A3M-2-11 16 TaxID=2962043 RepID=UPI0020B6FDF3|nr:hypothetical protein [Allokutzneria sp. A3M-2-11 16]MCP3798418.1 hypothetical protein [Allokutzneria sp. A3M-2-11 16]
MDPNISALRRLVLAGWLGVPIGDPHEPDMLVYTRVTPVVEDSIRVKAHDDAIAFRRVAGAITATAEGTVVDVVTTVLGWSSSRIITW